MYHLRYVLGLSAGVGRDFEEAETALNIAKNDKRSPRLGEAPINVANAIIEKYKNGDFSAKFYSGEKFVNGEGFNFETRLEFYIEEARRSLARLERIKDLRGDDSLEYDLFRQEIISRSKCEGGSSNAYGYALSQLTQDPIELEKLGPATFVLFDADNVKYWNGVGGAGYGSVTSHILAIERALVKNLRTTSSKGDTSRDHRKIKTGTHDLVLPLSKGMVSRTHGDAGDEFLVKLWVSRENLENVVLPRVFEHAYLEQLALYNPRLHPE